MKRIYYTLFLIVLGMAEMNAQRQQSEEGQSRSSRFGRQMDANGDGKISREEFPGPKETFDQFDKDKDNFLSNDERNAMRQSRGVHWPRKLRCLSGPERRGFPGYRQAQPVIAAWGH